MEGEKSSCSGVKGSGDPEKNRNALKPIPLKPCVATLLSVSKNTPPPARSTVSSPALSFAVQATPRRGAKLYHDVFQRGVPRGANASDAGLLMSPCKVYASLP